MINIIIALHILVTLILLFKVLDLSTEVDSLKISVNSRARSYAHVKAHEHSMILDSLVKDQLDMKYRKYHIDHDIGVENKIEVVPLTVEEKRIKRMRKEADELEKSMN